MEASSVICWACRPRRSSGGMGTFNLEGFLMTGKSTFLCEHLSIESYWNILNRCDPSTCAPCNCRWTAFWWQVMTTKNRGNTHGFNFPTSPGLFPSSFPTLRNNIPTPCFSGRALPDRPLEDFWHGQVAVPGRRSGGSTGSTGSAGGGSGGRWL